MKWAVIIKQRQNMCVAQSFFLPFDNPHCKDKTKHTHTHQIALDLVERLREQHLSQREMFALVPVDRQATTWENEERGARGCLKKVTYKHHRSWPCGAGDEMMANCCCDCSNAVLKILISSKNGRDTCCQSSFSVRPKPELSCCFATVPAL